MIVLDAVGAGELPDAGRYGDEGSNTLGNVAKTVGGLDLPMECANEIKPVLLYFDHGEKFMRTVRRPWEKWKRQRGSLFRQIRSIEHTDSEYYPIQAADILGMSARHILSGPASYRPSGGIIQRVLRLLEPLSQRLPTLGQEPLDLLEMRWARSR